MTTTEPQYARTRKWHAKWIWSDEAGEADNVYAYFRKRFEQSAPTNGHRLFIAADTRYQLFVNGTFVERGAPQSQPFFQYYDEHDVSDLLRSGTNCVAVLVNHVGNLADSRGGLLLELVDSGGRPILCSNGDWRATRANAWRQNTYRVRSNAATPFQEFFDARKVPGGWNEASFDDDGWPHAVVVGGRVSDRPPAAGPWARLIARDIPFMTSEPVPPHRVQRVDETLDVESRSRNNDLSPCLSMVGKPIHYARLDGAENLCADGGESVVQCSLNHLNLDFDGVYAPSVVLDFGKVVTARARVHFTGVSGGIVDIGYAERLIDGQFNIALECNFADRCVMQDGEQTFESFTWKAFRYLKLRFRSCFEPVTVHSVHAVISTYPYEERGRFRSDDDTLNAVFDISRETVRLCSNEFIMDTPWREQAQWLGDVALVTVPAIQSCFGDTALPRKFLMQAGQNQHPTGMVSNVSNSVNKDWLGSIPDYSLWWIQGVRDHFLYTGDEELLHRLYPQALRVLDGHLDYLNEHMLIEDMPYWVLIDWADTDRRGICSAYNGIAYGVLEALCELAEYRGDTYTVDLVKTIRQGMKANFHDTLFDDARGCYADANIDGELSEKISEHGNLTPVWAGLCTEDLAEQVIHRVFGDDSLRFTEAQPFYMAVVLRALDQAGRADLALDLIRQRWGRRMVDKGATSVYEEWYQNGSWRSGEFKGFQRSHSHAWSAGPADFLVRNLLGLEILAPGCRKLALNPKATPFDYHLVFPTPQGPVTAQCRDGNVTVTTPDAVDVVTE